MENWKRQDYLKKKKTKKEFCLSWKRGDERKATGRKRKNQIMLKNIKGKKFVQKKKQRKINQKMENRTRKNRERKKKLSQERK